jgi:recombination protein RecA
VSQDFLDGGDSKSDISVTGDITAGSRALGDGAVAEHGNLLNVFDALSDVFPGDPVSIEAFNQARRTREALYELELQIQEASRTSHHIIPRVERDDIYRRMLHLFEAEVNLSRKHKRASMALGHNWSRLPSYLREGILAWHCRLALRSGTFFSRIGFSCPQYCCHVVSREQTGESPFKTEPKLSRKSDLTSVLVKRGITIVTDRPARVIRTSCLAIDAALQIGGFPRGRIVEIFGDESTGKTTLALLTAASAQRGGEAVAYFDQEHKLHFPWARAQGFDVDSALVMRGTTAKQTLDSILDVIRSGQFALVIIDTIAALVPDENIEDSQGSFSGEMGQLFARTLPRIALSACKTDTCVLLLNQIRHNNERLFGRIKNPAVGGHALGHYSSIRLELSRLIATKNQKDVVGSRVQARVIKNCLGSPWRIAEWNINFERGSDFALELVELGLSHGLISGQPKALTFRGEHLGATPEAAHDFLIRNADVAAVLESGLKAKLRLCTS